jgi:catechol 2,3-dioxygenase-like lactoylglutathione lyase family enzyme
MDLMADLPRMMWATVKDVVPVMAFMLVFYRVVLGQRLVSRTPILVGFGFIVVGLTVLLLGVDKALFPAGRMMAEQLIAVGAAAGAQGAAGWADHYLVYAFAFCIAFGAALAEPALFAISLRVNELSGGTINATGLRIAAAIGVASGVAIGCIRIVSGIPLHWCIASVFAMILVQTLVAPRSILALAYDTGGVSTTVVTVPVVTALGLGIAEQLPGRSALLDGFGLIAFACMFPAISVLAYAQFSWLFEKVQRRRRGETDDGGSFR